MTGLLLTAIARSLRHPRRTIRAIAAGIAPNDPTASRIAEWRFGTRRRIRIEELFPRNHGSALTILGAFDRVFDTSIDREELLCVLRIVQAIDARNILEIGTFDGNTTLNLAANTPPDARITTVDLPIEWDGRLAIDTPDAQINVARDRVPVGLQFLGTPHAPKIRQMFCDSARLDWRDAGAPFDLVFIDGCHAYAYVRQDTLGAIAHVRRGGAIVWHDYAAIADVSTVVDELGPPLGAIAIAGTRLAVGFIA
jgi:predicted O-methyltransferase YrrM